MTAASATSGRFVALAPQRICDTRGGLGGRLGPIGPGETLAVQIAGVGGVPSSGVTAVAVNVTSVNATEPGFFSVFPSNVAATDTSSLNLVPGRAVPNMAIVGVGWASIVSLPFAIFSQKIGKEEMGLYMGLFNLSVVLPQLVVSLGISLLVSRAADLRIIFVVSAVTLIISALAWTRVRED